MKAAEIWTNHVLRITRLKVKNANATSLGGVENLSFLQTAIMESFFKPSLLDRETLKSLFGRILPENVKFRYLFFFLTLVVRQMGRPQTEEIHSMP